ncbi:hypothetical protein FJTKL_07707 [Diaporthe vaccinii]|uniref:Uncharacterized protein n=1 Tax=Diaporthe vaccinii TaxID=105482 RepID=A0ABR4ETC6_9PEZI
MGEGPRPATRDAARRPERSGPARLQPCATRPSTLVSSILLLPFLFLFLLLLPLVLLPPPPLAPPPGATAISRPRGAYHKRSFTDHDGADILWQKARALWKGGWALLALGDESKELEAQQLLDAAVKIYWDVSGKITDEPSMTDSS